MSPLILLAGCSFGTDSHTEVNEIPVQDEVKGLEDQASDSTGTKVTYLNKLADVEDSLKEFDKVYESGTQADMNKAKSETFQRWDDTLNEIYGVLKDQLSESEWEKLKKEQSEWMEHRDQTAEEKSLEAEGGTLEPFIRASVLADLTKERCYELVNNYMK